MSEFGSKVSWLEYKNVVSKLQATEAEVERLKQENELLRKYEIMYNNYWKYGTFEGKAGGNNE